MATDLAGESTELLQALIRSACVNDGHVESGQEVRNADILRSYLEGAGLGVETFESQPGRASIVARIEGSDPAAPKLCLMGHTDVVPVSPAGWRHDPFGGELIAGEVWGRGAVDMLNLTATMAVSFRHLAQTGFRPAGDLIFFGVADEEAGGRYGARWMVDNHWDAIACDYVLTENGGVGYEGPDGRRKITFNVAEKGIAWRRLVVRGTPGHGSRPYKTDNALLKAAEVVRRLAAYRPKPAIGELFKAMVAARDLPDDVKAGLLDPDRLWDTLDALPPGDAGYLHACTHTTFSPNMIKGGVKTNVIPDSVQINVDIRTVPGTSYDDVDGYLQDALGDVAGEVTWSPIDQDDASQSRFDTPLWELLTQRVRSVFPDADTVPGMIVGGTDARFFRGKGTIAYGAGLFSPAVTPEDFASRFHGHDERIDVASLGLTAQLWLDVMEFP